MLFTSVISASPTEDDFSGREITLNRKLVVCIGHRLSLTTNDGRILRPPRLRWSAVMGTCHINVAPPFHCHLGNYAGKIAP